MQASVWIMNLSEQPGAWLHTRVLACRWWTGQVHGGSVSTRPRSRNVEASTALGQSAAVGVFCKLSFAPGRASGLRSLLWHVGAVLEDSKALATGHIVNLPT